jgi:hypothetical protein
MIDSSPIQPLKNAGSCGINARREKPSTGRQKTPGDSGNLRRRFAFTKHDLWKPLPDGPMMIDRGKAQILKGQKTQARRCSFHTDRPRLDTF